MKVKPRAISFLKMTLLGISFFCKVEGADFIQEMTHERVEALLTRIVNVETQMQENVLRYSSDITRVIVLGNTGSGKSTLVHALARKPMIVQETGSGPFIDVNEEHRIPNFTIRRGVVAGTQQPTSWFDPSTNLVFWDCPGFMDPSGVSRDIETLFAVERLFTPPCNIKILLTIDKNAQQADRGQSIMKRLKNLRSFFTEEEQLQRAVSIVVTKQRPLRNGQGFPEPSTIFEEMRLIGAERNIAERIGITQKDLEWVSSFLTHLKDNSSIFAFPEPLETGLYDYNWFPNRERMLTQPVPNPTVNNIFSNFEKDARVLLLMERAAGQLTLAVDQLHDFFRYIRQSIPLTKTSLEKAKSTITNLNNLSDNMIDTPARLAQQLRNELEHFGIDSTQRENCQRILDKLSASEAYKKLLDKLDNGKRAQVWKTGVPNIPRTLKGLAQGSLADLQHALSNMGCSGKSHGTIFERYGDTLITLPDIELEGDLFDFRYPKKEDILSRFERETDARLQIDSAMFNTIDVGAGCVGVTQEDNWSKNIHEEFSWGLSQELGIGVEVKAKAGLFGFGVESAVSTSFKFGAHQNWRHSEDKTLSTRYTFTPETEGVYKLGMFTVGMEGFSIPFSAKILFRSTSQPVTTHDIIQTVRQKYLGVTELEERAEGVICKIEGTLTAKSALETIWIIRKIV